MIIKLFRATLALLLLLPTIGMAQAQPAPPPAGRFVLAVGAVQVQRGGQVIQARTGTPIRSGDVIRTAPASSAQLWFSDGSMLAIRERSEFRVDSYRFVQGGNGSSQVNSIVKGGARMLTGAIGRANPNSVKVNTRVALIGIRGTGFDLIDCVGQCIEDGQTASEGLYGTVFEGAISMTNENGTDAVLDGKSFYVATSNAPVIVLDRQPSFLAEPVALIGAGEPTSDIPPPDVPAEMPANVEENTTPDAPSAQVVMPPPEQADALSVPAVTFNSTTQGNSVNLASSSPAVLSLMSAEYNPVTGERNVQNLLSGVRVSTSGQVVAITYPRLPSFPGYAINGYTARLMEGGGDAAVVSWGRWADGSLLIGGWSGVAGNVQPLTLEKNQGFHWIVGEATTVSIPQGVYTFTLIGATAPTETRAGALGGWSVTKGSLTADLNAALLSGSMELFTSRGDGYGYFDLNLSGSLAGGTRGAIPLDIKVNKLTGSIGLCTATCGGVGLLTFFGNDLAKPASHAGVTYDFNTGQGFLVQGAAVFGR